MAARPRVSSLVIPLLEQGFEGQVCGVFASGLDITAGGGKLLYLGSDTKPLSCIGAQLPASWVVAILGAVKAEDRIFAHQMKLVFSRNGRPLLVLDLGEAEVSNLSLEAALSPEAVERLSSALSTVQLEDGLGLNNDTALGCVVEDLTQFAQGRRTDILAAISWLIGRGLGLTPTGDDILCGFGAGLAAAGKHKRSERFLIELQAARARRHTTAVSEAYLDAMVEGAVNEGIHSLLASAESGQDLIRPIERARDYGHTSGTDMLFGLMLGLGEPALIHA